MDNFQVSPKGRTTVSRSLSTVHRYNIRLVHNVRLHMGWFHAESNASRSCVGISALPTIRSTLSGLNSNRLSTMIFPACRYYSRLFYVLYSTPLSAASITTTDYPLCSETATASFRSEKEKPSAQLYLAIRQPTICCASLLPPLIVNALTLHVLY
jgi:hypothetical protein